MSFLTKIKIALIMVAHSFYSWLSCHAGNTEIGFESSEENDKPKHDKEDYCRKCSVERVDSIIEKFEKDVSDLEEQYKTDTSAKIDNEIDKLSSIIKISNRNDKT
jgi:thiaminase